MTLLIALVLLTLVTILNALAIGVQHNELKALERRHTLLVVSVARLHQRKHDDRDDGLSTSR